MSEKTAEPERTRRVHTELGMRPQCDTANACERQSAVGALVEHIHRLRRKADLLEALFNQLPRELSPAADAALWELVCDMRR